VSSGKIKMPGLVTDTMALLFLTRVALGMREVAVLYEELFQSTVADLRVLLRVMSAFLQIIPWYP
jgi:hypothetical protein